jgi:hypothetical protein
MSCLDIENLAKRLLMTRIEELSQGNGTAGVGKEGLD